MNVNNKWISLPLLLLKSNQMYHTSNINKQILNHRISKRIFIIKNKELIPKYNGKTPVNQQQHIPLTNFIDF